MPTSKSQTTKVQRKGWKSAKRFIMQWRRNKCAITRKLEKKWKCKKGSIRKPKCNWSHLAFFWMNNSILFSIWPFLHFDFTFIPRFLFAHFVASLLHYIWILFASFCTLSDLSLQWFAHFLLFPLFKPFVGTFLHFPLSWRFPFHLCILAN